MQQPSYGDEDARVQDPRCPVCLSTISLKTLEELKLTKEDLLMIGTLVKEQSLINMIELGKMAAKQFNPDSIAAEVQIQESLRVLSEKATELMDKQRHLAIELNNASEEKRTQMTLEAMNKQQEIINRFHEDIKRLEQDHKNEISQMTSMLHQIQLRISGVGIGDVRQTTVIKDLKSACASDEFSDEMARKGGTDIVAKVMDHGCEVGKIVVSVKETEKWSGEFIDQIKKNMKEEETEWGVLVSKSFPSAALNEKLYVDGNGILLVKTEYAPAAYMAIRHAALYKHQAKSWLKNYEESAGLQKQIVGVLESWVNGEDLKRVLASIDEANNKAAEADELLQKLQTQNEKQLKSARECQDKITKCLQLCSMSLGELKEKLPIIKP